MGVFSLGVCSLGTAMVNVFMESAWLDAPDPAEHGAETVDKVLGPRDFLCFSHGVGKLGLPPSDTTSESSWRMESAENVNKRFRKREI